MKFKNLLLYTLLSLGFVCLSGCMASKGKVVAHVPCKTVENFFVRNDVEGMPPMIIKASDEFERYFGMAATMGPDGRPTDVDFNKNYVICVALPPTDLDTDLSVESLSEAREGKLILRYAIRRGERRSYSIRPLLLLMVDKKYEMPVELKAELRNN